MPSSMRVAVGVEEAHVVRVARRAASRPQQRCGDRARARPGQAHDADAAGAGGGGDGGDGVARRCADARMPDGDGADAAPSRRAMRATAAVLGGRLLPCCAR